jgi:hypothetical protein
VKKRLARHMEAHGCTEIGDYLRFLREDSEALEEAWRLLAAIPAEVYEEERI